MPTSGIFGRILCGCLPCLLFWRPASVRVCVCDVRAPCDWVHFIVYIPIICGFNLFVFLVSSLRSAQILPSQYQLQMFAQQKIYSICIPCICVCVRIWICAHFICTYNVRWAIWAECQTRNLESVRWRILCPSLNHTDIILNRTTHSHTYTADVVRSTVTVNTHASHTFISVRYEGINKKMSWPFCTRSSGWWPCLCMCHNGRVKEQEKREKKTLTSE